MTSYRTLWRSGLRFTLRHQGVRRGLVVLAVALFLLTVTVSQYRRIVINEIGGLRQDLEQKRRETVDAQYVKKVISAYDAGKKQMAALEKKLQVAGVQSTLVHDIERLCRLNEVQLLAQTYQDGKVDGSYALLQHELAVAGSYRNLRRLIRDMERLPTLTFVEEASFSKSSGRDARLKLSLRLATYYRVGDPKPVN